VLHTTSLRVLVFNILALSYKVTIKIHTIECVYNGKVSIIESRYNVYRPSLDATLCVELNGAYNGLATLSDFGGDRSLIFGVSTPEHSLNGMVVAPPLP